jgi:hypothetical protein
MHASEFASADREVCWWSVRDKDYGSNTIEISRNPGTFQNHEALIQIDATLSWEFNDGQYGLTVVDWQGPFYYARATFRWYWRSIVWVAPVEVARRCAPSDTDIWRQSCR